MFGKIKKLKRENDFLIAKNNILEEGVKMLKKSLSDKDKEIKALKFRLENPPKYKVGKKFDWGKVISVELIEPESIFQKSIFYKLVFLELFLLRGAKHKGLSNEVKKYISENAKHDWVYKIELTTGDIMEVKQSQIS